MYLLLEKEKTKQHNEFNNSIVAFTFDAPNLLNKRDTNKLAKDNPKYTSEPIKACSL